MLDYDMILIGFNECDRTNSAPFGAAIRMLLDTRSLNAEGLEAS